MSHVTLEQQARRKRQEEIEKQKQEEALKKQQVRDPYFKLVIGLLKFRNTHPRVKSIAIQLKVAIHIHLMPSEKQFILKFALIVFTGEGKEETRSNNS